MKFKPIVLAFVAGVNFLGFFLMGLDKAKAKMGWWRVKETTLLGLALVFGSFGVYAGLKIFKHKTKHKSFTVTLPVLMMIQAVVLVWFYFKCSDLSRYSVF
jgi:uncharacterized membrane protein YsdA (DUF1294 family)